MRVAVVDVGANTLRLLVAETDARGGFVPIREERRRTGLGEDVERCGRLTPEKIERSAEAARKEVRRARKLGAARIEIVVTSPWRSAENGQELITALEQATGLHVQPLSEQGEAELGFVGALSRTHVDADRSPSATSAAARRRSRSARETCRPGCGRSRSDRSGSRSAAWSRTLRPAWSSRLRAPRPRSPSAS